jgi:3D (Asp-Asp-Asp) domain-containing protein
VASLAEDRFLRLIPLGLVAFATLTFTLPDLTAVARAAQRSLGDSAVVVGTDGKGVKVRSGPGLSYKVVGTIAEGEKVGVTDGPQTDDDLLWYQVRGRDKDDEAIRGWVAGQYLVPSEGVSLRDGKLVGTRSFSSKVTSYASGHGLGYHTATGTRVRWGTVAVDPKFIPLGSLLTIEGLDGVFTAEDTGSAIVGSIIDVWFPDLAAALRFGTQRRTVTILREGY